MDWTLIKTKTGRTFAANKDDWEFLYSEKTKEKLQNLDKDGYQIVVFTNQGGVSIGKTKVADLTYKFKAINDSLNNIPMCFLSAFEKN